ncbi:MAG: FtsX-like permease family protein [Spirochaetia bacterium]|jgi:putative ABC transport system permease protein|nr:FtsX-like permease family protein [Spirochaetia bacterium]
MPVLIKIAARNLLQHRAKTLIIGLILMLGMIILVLGNSLVKTATEGIRVTYTNNFSGDLVVTASANRSLSLFSISQEALNGFAEPIPNVPEYAKIEEFLGSSSSVQAFSPQAATFGMISKDGAGRAVTLLFGVDPERYTTTFPDNLEILGGGFLQPGEEGIVLNERGKAAVEKNIGRPLEIGEKIQITSTTSTGAIKVRDVTVRGFFKFKEPTGELNAVSLVDVDTVRGLYGMTIGADTSVTLTEEDTKYIDFSIDSLFGAAVETQELQVGEGSVDFDNILGDLSQREALSKTDSGAYHYILVDVKDGVSEASASKELERFFSDNGIEARVAPWLEGAGANAKMVYNIKTIFEIVILAIAVVAAIIIMNTLVISVSERIPEIGTIRALGGTKAFIMRMIGLETLVIALVAGLVGVIISSVAVLISGASGIAITNEYLKALAGGAIFYPMLHLDTILAAFGMIAGIAVLSAAYPVAIAVSIPPVTAMRNE